MNLSLIKNTISLLSRIHAIEHHSKINVKSWLNQYWIYEKLDQLSKVINTSKISKTLDELPMEDIYNLPKSLIHGDVHSKNILIDKNGKLILIDWEELCYAPSLLDLTMFLNYLKTDYNTYDLINYYSGFKALSCDERLLTPNTLVLSKLIHQVWFLFEYYVNEKKDILPYLDLKWKN